MGGGDLSRGHAGILDHVGLMILTAPALSWAPQTSGRHVYPTSDEGVLSGFQGGGGVATALQHIIHSPVQLHIQLNFVAQCSAAGNYVRMACFELPQTTGRGVWSVITGPLT